MKILDLIIEFTEYVNALEQDAGVEIPAEVWSFLEARHEIERNLT